MHAFSLLDDLTIKTIYTLAAFYIVNRSYSDTIRHASIKLMIN